MNHKQDFLNHLQKSFREYFATIKTTGLSENKTKDYINGLMEAGRIFGISFDELQQILTQEQNRFKLHESELKEESKNNNQKDLNIPAFIRKLQESD